MAAAATSYSAGRLRLFRVHAVVMDGGRKMLKHSLNLNLVRRTSDAVVDAAAEGDVEDAVDILVREDDDSSLKTFAVENLDFVRSFNFYRNSPKENFRAGGPNCPSTQAVEIPDFAEADITLLSYVAKNILEKMDAVHELRNVRNRLAHSAQSEMSEAETASFFKTARNVAKKLFQGFPKALAAWNSRIDAFESGPLGDVEAMERRLRGAVAELRDDVQDIGETVVAIEAKVDELMMARRLPDPAAESADEQRVLLKCGDILKDCYRRQCSLISIPGAAKTLKLKDLYINIRLRFKAAGKLKDKKALIKDILKANDAALDDSSVDELVQSSDSKEESTEIVPAERRSPRSVSSEKAETSSSFRGLQRQPTEDIEYREDAEEETLDDLDCEVLDFMEFMKIIDRMFVESIKRILITAGGGYGKTTASKRLSLHWADDEVLRDCLCFVRIDFKSIRTSADLFSATLEQFPEIGKSLTPDELKTLESAFERNQDKLFFALDGLDESKSKRLARNVLDPRRAEFPNSLVTILTRPEGKRFLSPGEVEFTEFEITKLTSSQFRRFVRQFPFTIGRGPDKADKLLDKCEENPNFAKLMEIPLTAVMNCTLFNDERLGVELADELDLFASVVALYVKIEELKRIDGALGEPDVAEEIIDRLTMERSRLLTMTATEILKEFRPRLYALGKAVFVCNGNQVSGFKDCDRKILESEISSTGLSTSATDSVLRLSFMEEIVDESGVVSTSAFRFLHRDIREFVVGIFLTLNTTPLPTPQLRARFHDPTIIVFRCVLALHASFRLPLDEFRDSVHFLVDHVIASFEGTMTKWRGAQMMCELLLVYLTLPDLRGDVAPAVRAFMEEWMKTVRAALKDRVEKIEKRIDSHFLRCLRSHSGKRKCGDCRAPAEAKEVEFGIVNGYVNQWPKQHPFGVAPFFHHSKDGIVFVFPRRSWIKRKKHVDAASTTLTLKPPRIVVDDKKRNFPQRQELLRNSHMVKILEATGISVNGLTEEDVDVIVQTIESYKEELANEKNELDQSTPTKSGQTLEEALEEASYDHPEPPPPPPLPSIGIQPSKWNKWDFLPSADALKRGKSKLRPLQSPRTKKKEKNSTLDLGLLSNQVLQQRIQANIIERKSRDDLDDDSDDDDELDDWDDDHFYEASGEAPGNSSKLEAPLKSLKLSTKASNKISTEDAWEEVDRYSMTEVEYELDSDDDERLESLPSASKSPRNASMRMPTLPAPPPPPPPPPRSSKQKSPAKSTKAKSKQAAPPRKASMDLTEDFPDRRKKSSSSRTKTSVVVTKAAKRPLKKSAGKKKSFDYVAEYAIEDEIQTYKQ